ncbi:hypothetical protein QR680_015846 [Steinernema hermaphroditum]|uniref:Ig-like domain-containing protein n=1 Tax=Steinernema hermaphroditum TaxID=289476 RepID=A0AA39HA72_9BILA|nr:hypothetical protein QR680_015846 [Steinernema hermaphroditum]
MIFTAFLFFLLLTSTEGRFRSRETIKPHAEDSHSAQAICKRLQPVERAKLVKAGKCLNTTDVVTTPAPGSSKSERMSAFFDNNAKKILRGLYVRTPRKMEVIVKSDTEDKEFLEGTFVTLTCDIPIKTNLSGADVDWYFSKGHITNSEEIGWRIKVQGAHLKIEPLVAQKDRGTFQCYQDGSLIGAVEIKVMTTNEVLWTGFLNYLITMGFAAPIVVLYIVLNRESIDRKPLTNDPVTEYYEEQLHISSNHLKGNLQARLDEDCKALEHPVAAENINTIRVHTSQQHDPGVRNNQNTIMTFLRLGERKNAEHKKDLLNLAIWKEKQEALKREEKKRKKEEKAKNKRKKGQEEKEKAWEKYQQKKKKKDPEHEEEDKNNEEELNKKQGPKGGDEYDLSIVV